MKRIMYVAVLMWVGLLLPAHAQELNQDCTVNVLNRTAQVNEFGGFVLPNVPVDRGLYRVRAVCERNGTIVRGQSSLLELTANGETVVGDINFGQQIPAPSNLRLFAEDDAVTLIEPDQTTSLVVFGDISDGRIRVLDGEEQGTIYVSSNPDIASVNASGVVTAHTRGRVNIVAVNEGRVAGIDITVDIPDDRDGDGLTDGFEVRNGLNPDDPTDAALDLDADGLNNLEEQEAGTNIRVADTDGDGMRDGFEARLGTDPARADTDGDGLQDGEELIRRTDPTNADTDGDGISDGTEVDFGLDPRQANATTTVTGRVVDPDGLAVPGAVVIVAQNYVANTDEAGTFAIENVVADAPIDAQVRFIVDGAVMDAKTDAVDAVEDGVTDLGEIQLRRILNAVGGTVYSPRDEPVADARVRVIVGDAERTANTDRGGVYLIRHVAEGDLTVVATDASTGLRGRAFGTLLPDEALTVDVRLSASGTIEGRVIGRGGATLPGGTAVTLRGPQNADTVTDELGRYRFDFIPLGQYTLEAFDDDGNRGRTTAAITGTNQVVEADISFLGVGVVQGIVETGGGAPVADAQVRIIGRGPFGGRADVVSGPDGRFRAENIFIGRFDVSVVDPATGLAGGVSDSVDFDFDVVDVTVTLRSAGSVAGFLYASDGQTPVDGGTVTLDPSGRTVQVGADGAYRFDAVPLGAYTLTGTAAAGPDRGRAPVNLVESDVEVAADVTLLGLGEVDVTVRDADGQTVNAAQVTITSQTGFDQTVNGITGADGQARLTNVLAGPFAVHALDPLSGLVGRIESTVLPGESVALIVELEGAGSITGRTLAPDGQTPIRNVRVILNPGNRTVQSDALGVFRFDLLPVAGGPYQLQAFDGNGTLRATEAGLGLMDHGDVVEQDLVLSGTGRVEGTITNPDGSNASAVAVVVESDVQGAPPLFTTTAADGTYGVDGVPEGQFTVTASNRPLRRAGSARGAVAFDGEVVTVDVAMEENIIPPSPGANPLLGRLYDANNFQWSILQDGRTQDGTQAIFRGDAEFNRGAMALSVRVQGGIEPIPFEGTGGRLELDGRQIVMAGRALGDISITRKAYTPNTGYFVRYLESFTNTSAEPQVIDVRIDSHFRFISRVRDGFTFNQPPRIVQSSNGDNSLNFGADGDRWAVIDDDLDADPFLETSLPAFAHVFDGVGGERGASAGEFTLDDAATYGRMRSDWTDVLIPPGATITIMHFGVQQVNQAGAQAAAERLTQAPAEALFGLTDAERLAIVNFDLDAGAGLEDLPALTGTVNGTVFEGDGETTVRRATVAFRSEHPLFGRTFNVQSADDGGYELVNRFGESSNNRPIPQFDFEVWARHPISRLESTMAGGAFPGEAATRDIIFENAGRIAGEVRRSDGNVVSTGVVRLVGDDLRTTTPIAEDGRFEFGGLLPGNYTLTAEVPIPGGTPLGGTTQSQVVAGATTDAEITIVPTGGVNGTVRDGGGRIAIDVRVNLRGDDLSRRTQTDTGGRHSFLDIPVGDYTLSATEPRSGVVSTVPVAVEAFEVTPQDIDLIAIGRVRVVATFSDGAPAVNAPIQILRERLGNFYRSAGRTGADGELLIEGVPAGNFIVRGLNPGNSVLQQTVNGMVQLHDEIVDVNLVIPVDDPPTVRLLSPVAGDVVEGTTVSMRADALDDNGIRRVEFLVDGNVVATDSFPPYIQSWVLPQGEPGPVSIVARAYDTGPNRTDSDPVVIQRIDDAVPPAVAIASPFEGASFIEGTTVTIVASANDDVGVDRVEYFVDGVAAGVDEIPPYRLEAPLPQDAADGGARNVVLRAVGYDRAGNAAAAERTIQVIPDAPPTIELVQAPEPGSRVVEGTPINIEANAEDDVGVGVDLIVDGAVVATRNQAPFVFNYIAPPVDAVDNPFEITVRARDTQGQTADALVRVEISVDQPPTVQVTAPAADIDVVEGSLVQVSAEIEDDLGVTRVEFLADGQVLGTAAVEPYSAEIRIPSGDAGPVPIEVRAFDTAGQTGTGTVSINRLDDAEPPTVQITSPQDGATLVVGASDIIFAISPSTRYGTSETDFDGDGEIDTLLEAQVIAARAMLARLDPDAARIGVVTTEFNPPVHQGLTRDYAAVDAALEAVLERSGNFTEYTDRAIDSAVAQLLGPDAERTAAPVTYTFVTQSGRFIQSAAENAATGGVVVNPVLFGPEQDFGRLAAAAQLTGGRYVHVQTQAELEALADSVLIGADALVVNVDADDDIAVRRVNGAVASDDGAVQEASADTAAPYELIFGLPQLDAPTAVTITAEARDYGDNVVQADPVSVTVLPSNQAPQIVALEPALGVPGDVVTIRGRYFAPVFGENTVTFNGVPAAVSGGNKSTLMVEVPAGATTGDVIVTADGQASDPVRFGIDVDEDGLDDLQEAELGTDPNNPDTDGDGLTDGAEVEVGANPIDEDTDDDGLFDGFEVEYGFDPTTPGEDGLDGDLDNLTNLQEFAAGTDPTDPDSDDDRLNDGAELVANTDPLDPDSDDGGTLDGYEVLDDLTDPNDPVDDVPRVDLAHTLNDGDNYRWDMQRDGNISNGTSDAYDGGLRLRVNGSFFPSQDAAIVEDDARELNFGPWATADLTVRRKIFVPANDRFARFLEVFENPTAAPIEVTVLFDTNLGSDGSTELVAESGGDGTFDPTDDWLITDDADASRDPSMAHIVAGPNAALRPSAAVQNGDNIDVTYTLTVPPGETAILMHFAVQNANRADATAQATTLRALGGQALAGLSAAEQVQIVNFVAFTDTDLDGLPDASEVEAGTDINNPDTDGDGMLDGYEVRFGLDPLVDDAGGDLDGDGLTNGDEHDRGTDPSAVDSDGDGLEDGFEVNTALTDPALADTDDDGLDDGVEVAGPTDPNDADSDDDGLNDGDEIEEGTDPNNPDTDGDGSRDGWEVEYNFDPLGPDNEIDFDQDGLLNPAESDANTSPFNPDTDGDALGDGDEVNQFNTNPTLADTDGGGRGDAAEVLIDLTDAQDPDDDQPVVDLTARLNDGAGFLWDITSSGTMSNGTSDAFDGAYRLEVADRSFFGPRVAGTRQDGRELALGPWQSAGLYVARMIYVPADDAFARYREVLINPTNAPIEVTVEVSGNMGSDGGTVLVGSSNADEAVVDAEDDWFVTDDGNAEGSDPAVFHLFSDVRGAVQPTIVEGGLNDNFRFVWQVTVPANQRVVVMHFSAQHANRPDALANAARIAGYGGRALEGMDRAAQNQVVNMVAYIDTDEDGLPDADEITAGTDPADPDSDDDGLLDGFEVDNGFDPLAGGDGAADPDVDNRTNLQEQADGTNPNAADTDGDGLNDGGEADAGSDPNAPDTDGDGLTDGAEVNVHLTDPTVADTDAGGTPDGAEVDDGTDPLNPADDVPPDDVIELPPPGEGIEVDGSLDIDDPQWARPDEECGPDAELPNYHYDAYTIVNNTGDFQFVEVTAFWGENDGYLHVFDDPFDPENPLTCRFGNDDDDGTETSFLSFPLAPGERITVVASSYDAEDPFGAYSLSVSTPGFLE